MIDIDNYHCYNQVHLTRNHSPTFSSSSEICSDNSLVNTDETMKLNYPVEILQIINPNNNRNTPKSICNNKYLSLKKIPHFSELKPPDRETHTCYMNLYEDSEIIEDCKSINRNRIIDNHQIKEDKILNLKRHRLNLNGRNLRDKKCQQKISKKYLRNSESMESNCSRTKDTSQYENVIYPDGQSSIFNSTSDYKSSTSSSSVIISDGEPLSDGILNKSHSVQQTAKHLNEKHMLLNKNDEKIR